MIAAAALMIIIQFGLIQIANAEFFRTCIVRDGGSVYCSNRQMISLEAAEITQLCEFVKYDAMLCSIERDYCGCAVRPNNCTNNSTDVLVPLVVEVSRNENTITAIIVITAFAYVLICFVTVRLIYLQKHFREYAEARLVNVRV